MGIDRAADALALEALTSEERQQIVALGEHRDLDKGVTVIGQGTEGTSFFVLLSGSVEVNQDGKTLAELGPGNILGEMALFHSSHRVASVVTLEASKILEIPTKKFWPRVLHQDPAAVKLLQTLGQTMVERLQEQDSSMMKLAGQAGADTFRALKQSLMRDWSLKYHTIGRTGKLGIVATKPSGTAAALSIAYSPGVADPCIAIAEAPDLAYEYTAKGHLVGVISNGTAVLGLGDIGALASKPVMEGKVVLLKRFADLDAFDIEVDQKDPEKFIETVCAMAPTFGGINLEDVKAPECFHIETECQARLDIPVFHDDQHGTAIVAGAALQNALELVGKPIEDVRMVFSGAGAAGFTCAKYVMLMGARPENILVTDIGGVVYKGRGDTDYLVEVAVDTEMRTLAEAMVGADVFMGLSVGNIVSKEMLLSMAADPIVFAMANPTPEVDPSMAMAARDDLILGTGRSDYPNQINNVVAFPYIFRGALDCRAKRINQEMKLAASKAIAALAKQPITAGAGFESDDLSFGRQYVVPKPFDRRLLAVVSSAVAQAAADTGVAGIELDNDAYAERLSSAPEWAD